MRVRGRHEIRLEPININSALDRGRGCLLQQALTLHLSSKGQDTVILGKSFYQSLTERSVFSIPLLRSGVSDSTVVKGLTELLLGVMKY